MEIDLKSLAAKQQELKKKLIIEPYNRAVRYILGIDSSYVKTENIILSVAVVYDLELGDIIETAYEVGNADFPYIPGYLSFREIPTTISAVKKIKSAYDLIMVDAQGVAHPRQIGFASHLGVVLDIPTIGCAKKRLIGEYEVPSIEKGSFSFLYFKGLEVGAVLRTKKNVKPVFISPGHRTDISSSIRIVLDATKNYRLPEPVRLAHIYSRKTISEVQKKSFNRL